jgi:N-methylhydantoinase A
VVGARLVGEAVGITDLLTLDMGGTSADASLVQGGAVVAEGAGMVAGVPLALPAVLIETVSAGGGSIAWVDAGGALKVGPESAGAVPGPACYGRGGTQPTVTDACLVLGWLDPARPLADDVRLDRGLAERALAPLAAAIGRDVRAAAAGVVEVATAVMARALKRVSVARGVDPRRLALLPFGGAGPLFGCALADALGMRTVVVPPHPGALSALGLASAPERLELTAAVHRPLAQLDRAALDALFAPLLARVTAALPGAATTRLAECRFAGQGYEIAVAAIEPDPLALEQVFLAAHRRRYGHAERIAPIEVVNVRVVGQRAAPLPEFRHGGGAARPAGQRDIVIQGKLVHADVWPLDTLAAGASIAGPAILAGGDATALVEPGWLGTVHASGAVIVEHA